MNLLLVTSALLYGVAGFALTFAPAEILAALGERPTALGAWTVQALGAALLGFAWLNWFHRYTITRGVLGRPVLMPNLMFVVVSFWLALGAWRRAGDRPVAFLAIAAAFGLLSIAFGARLFGREGAPEAGQGAER